MGGVDSGGNSAVADGGHGWSTLMTDLTVNGSIAQPCKWDTFAGMGQYVTQAGIVGYVLPRKRLDVLERPAILTLLRLADRSPSSSWGEKKCQSESFLG
jgi:hypothetical protein